MSDKQQPTFKQWLQDGATLVGLGEDQQRRLLEKGQQIKQDALRDLDTIEQGIKILEERSTAAMKKWRAPKQP